MCNCFLCNNEDNKEAQLAYLKGVLRTYERVLKDLEREDEVRNEVMFSLESVYEYEIALTKGMIEKLEKEGVKLK